MNPPPGQPRDVVILGGGLAGLTLALQLRQRLPDLDVLVLERLRHPVPHAAHKVGESSVEIGAHYFDTVLGLGEHMRSAHLRKFGFRFFFSEGRRDIDQVLEIGASRYLSVPSYQIDRGIFENFLAREAARIGVQFVDGATVEQVDLGDGIERPHGVRWRTGGQGHAASARWLVDACGRAGRVKRQCGLDEANAHAVNAAWFRIAEPVRIDEWSQDTAWAGRCEPPSSRWLSTNHLVGAGYWVWLIPLASGSHSVGIVADPALHPLEEFNTFDKAMDWLRRFQPRLFDALDGRRHLLQDFAFLRHFSHGCRQVFCGDRWALTGDAGLFLDPFYSPGSDFIAIGNTFICDLVARDRAGERLHGRATLYDRLYQSFYESTLALYQGQYPLFGDPRVLPVKVIWDYSYYWGVLAQIFFHGRLTELGLLGRLRAELEHARALNFAMQALLRDWSAHAGHEDSGGAQMLDHASLPWFAELNRSLTDTLDDTAFEARIRHSVAQLRQLAGETLARAQREHPTLQALLAAPPPGLAERAMDGPMLFAEPA